MKRKIVLLCVLVLVVAALCLSSPTDRANRHIPFLPIDPGSVTNIVLSDGSSADAAQTEDIIGYINGIKTYIGVYRQPKQPTPGPITSIRIYIKGGGYIILLQNYENKAILSDSRQSYVLSTSVIDGLLSRYSLFAD